MGWADFIDSRLLLEISARLDERAKSKRRARKKAKKRSLQNRKNRR